MIVASVEPLEAQPRDAKPAGKSAQKAENTPLELSWQAPENCPSSEFVRAKIRELLGAAADRATGLRARGEVTLARNRYRLRLSLGDGGAENERALESDSCVDLAGAAAVTLALFIRVELKAQEPDSNSAGGAAGTNADANAGRAGQSTPNASGAQGSTPSKPEKPGDAPVTSPGDGARDTTPRSTKATELRLLAQLPLLGLDVGVLPSPAATLGAGLGLRWGRARVLLGGRFSFGQTARLSDDSEFGVQLRRLTAELRGCYSFELGAFELGPCAFFALDRVRARGFGPDVASAVEYRLVPGGGVGALGHWRIAPPVSWVVSVGAQIEASRPQFVVEGYGELARIGPVALVACTGLEWNF